MDSNESAASDLNSPEAPMPEPRSDTFFLPVDFPGADELEEGDTVTLKVLGKSDDGIEVENVSEEPTEEPEDMGTALEKHMGGEKGSY